MSSKIVKHSLSVLSVALLSTTLNAATRTAITIPASFEANRGQAHASIKYLARARGMSVSLTEDSAIYSRPQDKKPITVRMVGANPNALVEGVERLETVSNYLQGSDPQRWTTQVPHFGKVRYRNLYNAIDLLYYGRDERLEFDLIVRPGGQVDDIRLRFEGARSATLDDGELVLKTDHDTMRWHSPVAYQLIGGHRVTVPVRYHITRSNEVRFVVLSYNHKLPLVIDPVLAYSSYLGGGSTDIGRAIAADGQGNAYITGATNSLNFPVTSSPAQTIRGGNGEAFVTKINASGTAVIFSTYLGGDASDVGYGIAVDSSNNVYVVGRTGSTNFPTTQNAFRKTAPDPTPLADPCDFCTRDGFVTKLGSSGSTLLYSSYLGGVGFDALSAITLNGTRQVYVAGQSNSTDFPTTANAFQPGRKGSSDAVLVKMDLSLSGAASLLYSSYLGGTDFDAANGVALDSTGRQYVAGTTQSDDFPITPGAYQTSYVSEGEPGDAFITKLDLTKSSSDALIYSTYFGTFETDEVYGVAVDASGNAHVPVHTSDNELIKLNSSGTALIYRTGLGFGFGGGIAIDKSGNTYVVGGIEDGASPGLTTPDAFQRNFAGGTYDAFVAQVSPAGTRKYYTYLGGATGEDFAYGVAVDPVGNAYITGSTYSSDFPTTSGAFDRTRSGESDGFVTKFNFATPCKLSTTNRTVSICTPPGEVTLTSPFRLVAGVTDSNPLKSSMLLYVDGVKTATQPGKNFDHTLSLPTGTHRLTVQVLDSIGWIKKTIYVTVSSAPACSLNTADRSVTICVPADNATASSPVHVAGGATSSTTISAIQIWVDGVKVAQRTGRTINSYLLMPGGRRRVTVQAIDTKGSFKKTIYVNVQ